MSELWNYLNVQPYISCFEVQHLHFIEEDDLNTPLKNKSNVNEGDIKRILSKSLWASFLADWLILFGFKLIFAVEST